MIPDELLGTHDVPTATDMENLGRRIGAHLEAGDLVVLTGPLGAGKTTLTRGLADALGVRGPIQSPTFVIARTHPSLVGGAPLVHADAYRLSSALELDDLDIDVDGSVVVMEWGRDKIEGLREVWWDVEITRPVGGRGSDTMCGDLSRASAELDADAPRIVVIEKRTAA
ncbi:MULTISPECIES: tRNA (adenosine(37)-N6)-threonylcarbamoyltransferase complex ATPase subunit type 1 TsaE [unclassified Microbacterium]|uniref:tRNA (adenosine(37)-N6)-threonylcarbamoyltransferase complex ATPase subunit type 1 TsaE n=1 Tax=Microbacterium TaxID=33882 RepID=UPI002B47B6AD|nr:tRNA (adenosine(37)-N6)-threonylcarbamoyltransferase complex ATPase subunit type 1 TsaE [Microbacterium sp. JZ37]WRH18164.1 tRNA (adenosine(37)-N6)-threonylcarbamoyltransferase complex ATPase subunit type 1 TsaE [Microbacterium sp. JZ37]